jgi:hypothetical protein
MAQVVENQQRVAEHEDRIGKLQVVARRPRQPLHVANHVVREVADRPALEAREPGHRHRFEVGEQSAEGLQRVAVGQSLRPGAATTERDPAVLGAEDHEGIGTQERIACPDRAALDGLQQEGVGAWSEPKIRRQLGVEIRRELGEHGHEVPLACEVVKLLTGRGQGRDSRAGGADANPSDDALHG